jgi:uncharacterized membrane protein YsdA (DUF1294 family)
MPPRNQIPARGDAGKPRRVAAGSEGKFREGRRAFPVSAGAILGLAAALALPVLALVRQVGEVDWRWLFGVPFALSVITGLAYRADKLRAQRGQWRISEATLHLLELLGGWPGAFLAQRRWRHKSAKVSYQVTFWTIVVVHQLVAADALTGWTFARRVLGAFR